MSKSGFNFGVHSGIRFGLLPTNDGGARAQILASFSYTVGDKVPFWKHDVFTVPEGFKTDFASVPRPLWALLPPVGDYAQAAVLHDYIYDTMSAPREVADQVFLEAMLSEGVHPAKAFLMYYSVRLFGPRYKFKVYTDA